MSLTSVTPVVSFLEPAELKARGTVVVVPGRGERPEVYRRFGGRISFDAYRVHVVCDPTIDAGRTQRQIEESIAAAPGPRPVTVVGSDTGALFAAGLVAEREISGVDGLILAGLPTAVAAPGAADSWDDELEDRTTCPTHRGRISDSLVTPGALYRPIPARWTERASLDRISQPILGLHGQADTISPLDRVSDVYAAAAFGELISIAGARHDVLNDQTHRTVAATIVLWLERLRAGERLTPIATPELVGADVA